MISAIATQFRLKNFAVARLSVLGLAACLFFTGCSQTESTAQEQELAEQALPSSRKQNDASTVNSDVKSSDNAESKPEGKPVSYDVQSWNKGEIEHFAIDDIDKMKRIFGKVAVTDENSLDYASNIATKYRFMKGEDPYLDIIDSTEYLEYGWYYANPDDSDAEKEISISHAKKAYLAAQGLMGPEGAKVVENMLAGQIIKDKEVGSQQVALAKCEFYSCMLILKKSV